ncbi:MAG: AAA family ATPase [Lysobacterales bacterium]|jgi:DNA-binding SARP family transcriptional activator/predicted ATPase
MSKFDLHFLGNFEVLHDGVVQDLPPSRKTRALLAFLALHDRSFRREYLCELLWEIPDDPRGSLRWSLSKLRRLVDSDQRKRIVADRANVRLDADDLTIDFVDLCELAEKRLADAPTATLEEAADRYRGHFLEGLEFSDFHDFHAWCVAERERAVHAREAILRDLIRRFEGDPERALPHARALVTLSPYDEEARAQLIGLLIKLRHMEEAEQQLRLGQRMLKELGVQSSGALLAAWRSPSTPVEPEVTPVAHPDISGADHFPVSTAIHGREKELALLNNALESVVRESKARILMLRGEPGIGKSTLLEALGRRALDAGAYLLEAGAYLSEINRPFALWIDALRRQSTEAEQAVFGDQSLKRRDRLLGRLSGFIGQQARQRPVVIVFDDFQWCDESSAAALHYVTRMNRERPVLGVIAVRAGELRDNVQAQQALRELRQDRLIEDVPVDPLPEADIRRLIAERVPAADAARLSRECGGNPLFAIELARAGGEAGTLDDLVRERLARFDEEGAEVLRWAAVLSPHIQFDTLVQLSNLAAEDVGTALERAQQQGVLDGAGDELRFSHELVARGVYKDISPVRRQVMHRRVAELMEANSRVDLDHAAQLAHHASHSGDVGLAARALVLAGRLCQRFFANEKALQHARRGLQLAADLSGAERVRVSIELHEIMLASGPVDDWESAAAEYVALAEQALDLGDLEHARLGYQMASVLRWEHGHWSDAQEVSLQAARIARGGDEEQNIIGLAETAKCLVMLERDLPQADAMLMEAQALAERRRFRHHSILIARGLLRLHEDRLNEAEELFLEARTLSKAAGDHISEFQANESLVLIAWYQGDCSRALKLCEPLHELAGKLREGSEEPLARALYGLCLYHDRDDPEPLDRAIDDLRIVDAKYRLAYTQSRAAMIDLGRERFDSARIRAREALNCAELLQRPTEMLIAHVALYCAASAAGDAAAAAAEREAMAALCERSVAVWARQQAQAAMAEGAAAMVES